MCGGPKPGEPGRPDCVNLTFGCTLCLPFAIVFPCMFCLMNYSAESAIKSIKKGAKNITLGGNLWSFKVLGDEPTIKVCDFLKNNPCSVEELDLTYNNLSDDAAIAVAELIKVNRKIKKIDLAFNHITDNGATAILEALDKNPAIIVDLGRNDTKLAGKVSQKAKQARKLQSPARTADMQRNQLSSPKTTAFHSTNPVSEVLRNSKLSNNDIELYAKVLYNAGYDSKPLLLTLDESKLRNLRIVKPGHISAILDCVASLNQNTLAVSQVQQNVVTVPNGYLFFISYVKIDTLSETGKVFDAAKIKFPHASIFRDTDHAFKLSDLVSHVIKSKNVLVFLSPNYCKSPYCMVEMVNAIRSGANILTVKIHKPGLELFNFAQVTEDLAKGEIDSYLDSSGWAILDAEHITKDEVIKSLSKILDVKAFDIHMDSPGEVINLEISLILKALIV